MDLGGNTSFIEYRECASTDGTSPSTRRSCYHDGLPSKSVELSHRFRIVSWNYPRRTPANTFPAQNAATVDRWSTRAILLHLGMHSTDFTILHGRRYKGFWQ